MTTLTHRLVAPPMVRVSPLTAAAVGAGAAAITVVLLLAGRSSGTHDSTMIVRPAAVTSGSATDAPTLARLASSDAARIAPRVAGVHAVKAAPMATTTTSAAVVAPPAAAPPAATSSAAAPATTSSAAVAAPAPVDTGTIAAADGPRPVPATVPPSTTATDVTAPPAPPANPTLGP